MTPGVHENKWGQWCPLYDNKKLLEEKGLETSDENIFISATCGEKGIAFLEGKGEMGIRYSKDVKDKSESPDYHVRVEGKEYGITVHSNNNWLENLRK